MDEHDSTPAIKFKRRKTTHTKRTRLEPAIAAPDEQAQLPSASPDVAPNDATTSTAPEEDGSSLALKEALRSRKRPRDRLREAAARAELTKAQAQALVLREHDAPKQGYTSRFVPQTGQVVDTDDQQITEYIEARQAEKNHRLYGWPIPAHLAAAVAAFAAESTPISTALSTPVSRAAQADEPDDEEKSRRLAAGMGKLEEIDLGPGATSRAQAAWKKLEGAPDAPDTATAKGKVRLGRDGKPRRGPKRRNSEDIRRDAMVEAVLREAKLDYFDAPAPAIPNTSSNSTNDEALVQQFRQEFLDSMQERQNRKPAAPARGTEKDAPKGPKLGGSRSARAKMHALEEAAAAKNKR